ncbi:MAG: UvrD-helicase domain-containing protein [Planctomycetes bacterium]|nr:UvrD-helicase domain-containing protein [Planctomycetota bacterium]
MSSISQNIAILAAAGSRKTECLVDAALAVNSGRVLITTYTDENQRHIVRRIAQKVGVAPKHITVMGWFSFLITQCIKPYQRALTGQPFMIGGLNFKGRRNRFTKKSDLRYFVDSNADLYRDGVSDLAIELNKETNGAVVDRLERIYSHLLIDEVQDLVGYDLDVLDLLLSSRINLMVVGDPRQHTFATNLGSRNRKYRGAELAEWFSKRTAQCKLEKRDCSYRCNQAICDFAAKIFPAMPPTKSLDVPTSEHDGVFTVPLRLLGGYLRDHGPATVLRYDKNADTCGLPAMNIGLAKGSTHDRVVIFPTKPMLTFLEDGDASKLRSPEKLYVAVTRARFSVAFVVPDAWPNKPLHATAYSRA